MSDQGPFFVEIRLIEQDDKVRRAYDTLYEQESLAQFESFYLWLFDQLRLPKSGTLLDVSCGSGEVIRLAAQRGLRATGIDISEVVARKAQRNVPPRASVSVSNGERLPFPDGCFDFVTSIGSLEHFVDPAQGAREMARVLRPGGKAFVLLPNTFSVMNIWIALRQGRTSADPFQPIQRYGARADWVHLLEANGLAVHHTLKYERVWPRNRADWGFYLRRPKEAMHLLAAPLIPRNLAWCFLFTCERKVNIG